MHVKRHVKQLNIWGARGVHGALMWTYKRNQTQ